MTHIFLCFVIFKKLSGKCTIIFGHKSGHWNMKRIDISVWNTQNAHLFLWNGALNFGFIAQLVPIRQERLAALHDRSEFESSTRHACSVVRGNPLASDKYGHLWLLTAIETHSCKAWVWLLWVNWELMILSTWPRFRIHSCAAQSFEWLGATHLSIRLTQMRIFFQTY